MPGKLRVRRTLQVLGKLRIRRTLRVPGKLRIRRTLRPVAEITVLDVGWPVYGALVAEAGDSGRSRIAYDGELLEIVSPSQKHEIVNRLLEALVREIGRAWRIDLVATGIDDVQIRATRSRA